MSNNIIQGFVFVKQDEVLTYDEISSLPGLEVQTWAVSYDSGHHGINGLCRHLPHNITHDFLRKHGLEVADVNTPWVVNGGLILEPEGVGMFLIEEEESDLVFYYKEGSQLTLLSLPDDDEEREHVYVSAKLSVGALRRDTKVVKTHCIHDMVRANSGPAPKVQPVAPEPSSPSVAEKEASSTEEVVEQQRKLYKSMFPHF